MAKRRQADRERQRRQPGDRRTPDILYHCEAEVAEGLEMIAAAELRRLSGVQSLEQRRPGALRFVYSGPLPMLLAPRTVQAIYLVQHFAVPRPKALLGDQHFRALLELIDVARALSPPDAFRTLYLSAAGAESAVMLRLKQELAQRAGLAPAAEEGDLTLRLRRPLAGAEGWEVLVRLSPRPLATRDWRVCNIAGALNAAVAHAMVLLGRPSAGEVVLNPGCGSGTLLIERWAALPPGRAIGCDTSSDVLACAAGNLQAAGLAGRIQLEPWDARALPLPAESVDALYADLPFGQLVGSHRDNLQLYPSLLREAARVARSGARFIAISMELRLMESVLAEQGQWSVEQVLRVGLGGIYPRIFVLSKRG